MKRLTSFVLGTVLSLSSCSPELTLTPPSPQATAPAPTLTPAHHAPSSTPEQTPTLTPMPVETVSFNWLRIVYSTTSNWNRLEFLDPDCLLTVRVTDVQGNPGNAFLGPLASLLGAGQPDRFGLFLNRTAAEINLQRAVPLSMTVEMAVRPGAECRVLRFEQHRGAWFSAKASVRLLQGGQTELLREIPLGENASFSIELPPPDPAVVSSGAIQRPAKMLWALYYPWWPEFSRMLSSPVADQPQIPDFSSEDPSAVAFQIQQARSAGIDGFFVSYNGTWLDERLKILLDAAQANGFLIAPHLEITDTANRRMWDTATVKQWIINVITKYGDHPALMKREGRPVFAVFMGGSWQRSEWEPLFAELAKEGYPAFFLSMGYNLATLNVYDGLYDLGVFQEPGISPGLQLAGRMVTNASLLQDVPSAPKIWMEPVAPGFDNTPYLSDATYPASSYVVPRQDGAYYRNTLQSALRDDPDWILINTWNEYGEGTHIEPSRRYGDLYLAITRLFAAQWKAQSSFPPEPTPVSPSPTPDFTGLPTPDPTPNADANAARAQAFANPILAALANLPPTFQDDFTRDTSEWFVQWDRPGRVAVEEGRLRIYVNSSPVIVEVTNARLKRLTNFVLMVDALPESPGFSGIRLAWRVLDSSSFSFYTLDTSVDDTNWNTGRRFNSGADFALLGNGWDKTIRRGSPIHLMIVVNQDEYAVYINGHPVAYVVDRHTHSGRIELSAAADPSQTTAVVSYDNLKVWDLDKGPSVISPLSPTPGSGLSGMTPAP